MPSTSSGLREGPRRGPVRPRSATSPPGSPASTGSIAALRVMVEAGCDAIEIGLPYSDPVMDGPTIQAAAQQALDGGVRTADVAQGRRGGGRDRRADPRDDLLEPDRALRRGALGGRPGRGRGSGHDHARHHPRPRLEWIAAADAHDLDKVFLVAPSSTDERIAMTTAASRGFVYAAAVMGVTGARDDHLRPRRLRWSRRVRASGDIPVARRARRQQRRPGRRGRAPTPTA